MKGHCAAAARWELGRVEVIHPSRWNGVRELPQIYARGSKSPPFRIMIPELSSVRLLLLPEMNFRSHSWGPGCNRFQLRLSISVCELSHPCLSRCPQTYGWKVKGHVGKGETFLLNDNLALHCLRRKNNALMNSAADLNLVHPIPCFTYKTMDAPKTACGAGLGFRSWI